MTELVVVVAGGDMVCAYPQAREREAAEVGLVMVGANLDVVVRRMTAETWAKVRAVLRAEPEAVIRDFTVEGGR